MKAFIIERGKIKEIQVCRTKAEAVLKIDGKIGYVVTSDGAIVKVKTINDYGAKHWWRAHLVIIDGPKKLIQTTAYNRDLYATAALAWAAHQKDLRAEVVRLSKELRTAGRACRKRPAKGSVSL